MHHLFTLLLVALLLTHTTGSYGDRQPAYRRCVSLCEQHTSCEEPLEGAPVSWVDGLLAELQWTCTDECKYECQQSLTDERDAQHLPAWQYHGKWPFRRVLGVQEIFSVVFSVLNAVPHIMYLVVPSYRNAFAPKGYLLSPLLKWLPVIGINTWTWSAAFHARDTWLTERLDYHCATLLVVSYFWTSVVRLVVEIRGFTRESKLISIGVGLFLIVVFLRHVYWLNAVRFDYGWNMTFTGVFFVSQLAVWMLWAFIARTRPHSRKIILFQIMLASAAIFEAVDFPPVWRLIDAHAVWHGLTIPLGFYWYHFLSADSEWTRATLEKRSKV